MSAHVQFRNLRRLLLVFLTLVACALQNASADNVLRQDEVDRVLDYLVTQRLRDRVSEKASIKAEQRAQLKRTELGMHFDPDTLRPLESLSSKFRKNVPLKKKSKDK